MSDPRKRGSELLRAVDGFWGERWDGGPGARLEIRSLAAEARVWSLDEVHEYDESGALRRSVFLEEGEPWLLRENEYGLPDCLARRTSRDLEEGSWTSWSYAEGTWEGRRAYIAQARTTRKGGPLQGREIYLLDGEGRVECQGIEEDLRRLLGFDAADGAQVREPELWRARRDALGRVVELRVEGLEGRPRVAWRFELDVRGFPVRELRVGAGGAVEEERRFEREYDEDGEWRRERELLVDPSIGPLFMREERVRAKDLASPSRGRRAP